MPTSTTITFQGLLIFRRDPATEEFEVGILRARNAHEAHILQIEISPDPRGGQGPWKIPPDDLERHIQNRDVRWQLEVEGNASMGVQAMRNKPRDRRNPTAQDDRDLGWIVNLEDEEFHNRALTRARNALQPIIRLQQGAIFTSCKPDSVDTIQGNTQRDFGFIAGGIGLKIDTSDGQIPVLNFVNQKGVKVEIFRLTRTAEVSYQISIFNSPLPGTPIMQNHFHLYYDLLFTGVPASERFDLKLHNPPRYPPRDRCDEAVKVKGLPLPTPNPFRCGGLLVGGEDPLD
ncbi:MAG TPA: hypothetical protein VFI24_20595 [Pyrinomonadaceae bacterium]|nr:hypothetical protein [Pyrinomonadaceae bacterium]